MSPSERLALEHLTAPAASPLEIVQEAASLGLAAATVLLSPFAAFPETSAIDLIGDGRARRSVWSAATNHGVTIAMVYPFVLTPRRNAASFAPALDAAAEIGAQGVGLLVYDRDAVRALEELEAFCSLAAQRRLRPTLEFFGGSAVPSLMAADTLKAGGGLQGLGICVDALHLMRSGGRIGDLSAARGPIVHAQLSDAPMVPTMERDAEAAFGRLAPGDGDFDLARFATELPSEIWLGVEVPPARGGEDNPARRRSIISKTRKALREV